MAASCRYVFNFGASWRQRQRAEHRRWSRMACCAWLSFLPGCRWRICKAGMMPSELLFRRQQSPVALDRRPVLEQMQNVPELRGLIAERGLAELLLEPIAHRLGQPGAAADIDRVAIRIVLEGAATKLIGHQHVVAR